MTSNFPKNLDEKTPSSDTEGQKLSSENNENGNCELTENKRIKKLPPLLVNQLAAGEVVTRPASVVKELIENAIDAEAKTIDIRITQGGMGIIEVCDDGCGIHPDDMVMAVTRFATSKIADVAHLQGITTLGFRGEALAATAAVSRLTLKSSCDDSGVGRELSVAGVLDDTPRLVPVVHPKGTTVTVKDLYFNVPARRGNLKSISTEFAHIEEVVKHLALVASNVSFCLWHNDKRRFKFDAVINEKKTSTLEFSHESAFNSGQSKLLQSALARLKAIFPVSHLDLLEEHNLQPISIDLEGLRLQSSKLLKNESSELGVEGFLIPSIYSNLNNTYRLIYINGRLVKDRRIAQIMRESGKELESLGYVLFFSLPKSWLNLNVHPSKQSIKIQNLANVMAHLEVGVKSALEIWRNRQPISKINKENCLLESHQADGKNDDINIENGEENINLKSTENHTLNFNNSKFSDSKVSNTNISTSSTNHKSSTRFSEVAESLNHYLVNKNQNDNLSYSSNQEENLNGVEKQRFLSGVKCIYSVDKDDLNLLKSDLLTDVDSLNLIMIQIDDSFIVVSELALLDFLDSSIHSGGTNNLNYLNQLIDEKMLALNNQQKIEFKNSFFCLSIVSLSIVDLVCLMFKLGNK